MLTGPVQIAYAVDDVFHAAANWAARGVGPFFVIEHIPVHNSRVRGVDQPFDHSSAYGQWGDIMIELICQHDGGPTPLIGASGIHHVAHFVDNFAAASTALTADGYQEALYAETSTGMPFAFHDALAARGHLIEIYERTPPLERFYAMVRSAAAAWDGTDPVRRL